MDSKIIEFSLQTLWELGVQWFALLLIIFVMAKLLFKPVSEFIEKRRAFIQGEIEEATRNKSDAIELKNDYDGKIKTIQQEADSILADARQKALQREEQVLVAAREEADAIKARALKEIELEQVRVRTEIKEEMVEVAGLMASKFVASTIDTQKQNELIDDMIKEMGDVQWLNS